MTCSPIISWQIHEEKMETVAHFILLNIKIIVDGDYSQEFYFIYFIFLSFDSLVFFSFIFISWRLITLQYCIGFCHTLT